MPSKSKAQAKFMRAAAHSKTFAKKAGIPQKTAKEWSKADSKRGTKHLPPAKADMPRAGAQSRLYGALSLGRYVGSLSLYTRLYAHA